MAHLVSGTPGHPLASGPFSVLETSEADKELFRTSKAQSAGYIIVQGLYLYLLQGQCLQLVPEMNGGNFGHISSPVSQDNARVSRYEFKGYFAGRKCIEVPHPLDGSERSKEHRLKRQDL